MGILAAHSPGFRPQFTCLSSVIHLPTIYSLSFLLPTYLPTYLPGGLMATTFVRELFKETCRPVRLTEVEPVRPGPGAELPRSESQA